MNIVSAKNAVSASIVSTTPKYQYHVKTWGGFYNVEHKAIHGLSKGDYFFDTEEERSQWIAERKEISERLNANALVFTETEGYTCNVRTVCHRITRFEGRKYYTTSDLGVNYSYSAAMHWMEYKWYPGFNDYPLGDEFDYENIKLKTHEWITGAFPVDFED